MSAKLPKGNYSEGFLKFFDYCVKYAKKHGRIIDIRDSAYVIKEGKCGGYCDGERVVISGRNKNFVQLATHELSHLHQSVENEAIWIEGEVEINKYTISSFQDYYKIIRLERDCELRALKFAKKYNLFDLDEYAKKANCYLLFHHYMFLNSGWIFSKKLYDKKIMDLMPTKIVSEATLKKIDMDLMLVYDKVLSK